jgi:type IV pilus assembly protein PilB
MELKLEKRILLINNGLMNKKEIVKKLEEILFDKDIVGKIKKISKPEDIFVFLKESNIDEEGVVKLKAEYYDLHYLELTGFEIKENVLNFFPKNLAENYNVVVFDKDASVLKVAIFDPYNMSGKEAMSFFAHNNAVKVKYYLVSEKVFGKLFKQYNALESEVGKALDMAEDRIKSRQNKKDEDDKGGEENVEDIVKSAPISKIVEVIINHGVEMKASDIHIEPFMDQTRVRYRIDGILRTQLLLPKDVHQSLVSRIKVISNLKIDETRIPQDGRVRLIVNSINIDFRISTLPLYGQEKVVMRILDTSAGVFSLKQLGFIGKNFDTIKSNIDRPNGMFLVTGPTGSGKSTTLYSILNILNKEGVNIVTLEDPVEYYLKGINQSQVNSEVGHTFAAGLRSILRQDPDVVMVGEIRDGETAELAIHAALTGHIVLSTLHTNDAFGAIPRLMEMGVEPFMLTSTLNVVVAQRLVRKICDNCKVEYQPSDDVKQFVKEEYEKIPKGFFPDDELAIKKEGFKFYKGEGCKHCNGTGFKGRVALVEALGLTDELRKVLSSGESLEKVKQEVVAGQMSNLKQDGIIKVLGGMTTIEEVTRASKND